MYPINHQEIPLCNYVHIMIIFYKLKSLKVVGTLDLLFIGSQDPSKHLPSTSKISSNPAKTIDGSKTCIDSLHDRNKMRSFSILCYKQTIVLTKMPQIHYKFQTVIDFEQIG